MNHSIEEIWKNGFINKPLEVPKINNLYNLKSINLAKKIHQSFKLEVLLNIPIIIILFCFNLWLDNDFALLWGVICVLPSVFWLIVGLKQLQYIKQISYLSNCHQYLISLQNAMNRILHYNKNLAIISVPAILTPLIIFTYYNQKGKTIGEIFGLPNLDLSTLYIFLLIPIVSILSYLIINIIYKTQNATYTTKISALIKDIEELKQMEVS